MFKGSYHPKAFLLYTKNVKQGLVSRTRIASILDRGPCTARTISEKTGASYSSIMHHLYLMKNEYIVKRNNDKPYVWELTGAGQKKLTEI
jgi:predicted transcriptional regulator